MSGLNLKGFKKVSTNKDYTVMKNQGGHEVRIAHKALSPHRKAQLDNLPVHLAGGPGTSDVADDTLGVPISAAPAQVVPPDAPPTASISPGGTMPTQVQQAQAETQGMPQDISDQTQNAVQYRQELLNEDQAWAQDLANGHVTPKTYGQLFAKKDTLGKVGTLFGLLVAGAGSGITGQPNAVMQMMQQEMQE